MKEQSYIYFLTNQYNNVLYLGVTNDIVRRIAEHKAKVNKGFSYKYNCEKLVYYETFSLITDAIIREKQLKNWKRDWKNKLINDFNPEWNDLSNEIGVSNDLITAVKAHYTHHPYIQTNTGFYGKQEVAGQARNDVHKQAVEKAEKEFEIYRQREMWHMESDFDRAVKQLTQKNNKQNTEQ